MAATGQVTVATPGTAVQGPNQVVQKVLLRAHPANAAASWVAVGFTQAGAAAGSCFTLALSDPPVKLLINNLNDLWFDCTVAGGRVVWMAVDD